MSERIFSVADVIAGISDKTQPAKIVLYENERTNGVVWYVPPGKEIPAHYHPNTDDSWVVLDGDGEYYLGDGETRKIDTGTVALASMGKVHGVKSTGLVPLILVAISAPMPVELVKAEK